MPSYQPPFTSDWLRLQFTDRISGLVRFQAPNLVTEDWTNFSSDAVTEIDVTPKYTSEVVPTAQGKGLQRKVTNPIKWVFAARNVTEKDNTNISRLHQAVDNEWEILAQIRSGFLLFNDGTDELIDSVQSMNCVIKASDAPWQQVIKGQGLKWKNAKTFELWETVTEQPAQAPIPIQIGLTQVIILGLPPITIVPVVT